MARSIIYYRKATIKDADQISSVLIDFYNMKDAKEASEAFAAEMEKDFHYIVALKNDVIIGLLHGFLMGFQSMVFLSLIGYVYYQNQGVKVLVKV